MIISIDNSITFNKLKHEGTMWEAPKMINRRMQRNIPKRSTS
jgi:hypothetical protein